MRPVFSFVNRLITYLLSLFGMSSCLWWATAYGCPSTTYVVLGKVVDENNDPIDGAKIYDCASVNSKRKNQQEITDIHHDFHYFYDVSDSTVSNPDGTYDVSVHMDGCYNGVFLLIASAPGYERKDTIVQIQTSEEDVVKHKLNIVLKKNP